jgi:hypothetical protein
MTYTLPPGLVETSFGDGGHWVSRNGKPIRSVSKILERIWPMPAGLPAWYLERGKAVHHATTLIDKGTLDAETVDERIIPFLSAYEAFISSAHPVVELSEETVVHKSYSYGGRLDRLYRFPGQKKLILVDIKTGTGTEPRYRIQCALLALALDEDNVDRYELALLNLDKDGKPHFSIDDDPGTRVNEARKILQDDIDFRSGKT